MTGNIERGALYIAGGIVVSAVVISIALLSGAWMLSKGLISAGEQSRSHYSTSFPSDLRVQVAETPMDLQPERRPQLRDAFIEACIGQVYDNKAITKVKLDEFEVKYWGSHLSFSGDIEFEDGSLHEGFEAHLHRDGFGGYDGFVRTKNGSHAIIKSIRIE